MTGSKMFKMFALIAFATVAFAGCSSDDDPVAPKPAPVVEVPDTAPPASPTGLSAVDQGWHVELSWDANVVDTDLAGYDISRTCDGETVVLTTWLHPLTEYVDDTATLGLNVYRVIAEDDAGNRSAAATVKVSVNPIQ
ncbi:MAG: hypothetical protein GY838_11590 [bacterium]|nr:hypothetical protein [bacterium]